HCRRRAVSAIDEGKGVRWRLAALPGPTSVVALGVIGAAAAIAIALGVGGGSHYPTWARPNWVSIRSGVPPIASGVRTNRHRMPVALDSLMDRARDRGLGVALATDYEVL